MKIYISDKDVSKAFLKNIALNEESEYVLTAVPKTSTIESLEQHDAEIRKHAYAEGYQQGKFDALADLEADEHFNRLAEYENLGTVEDFKNLIKEAQIMLKNNEKHKQSIKELSDSNSKFYKENEELKQQLAEQVKTVNIERIETFDNRKRW